MEPQRISPKFPHHVQTCLLRFSLRMGIYLFWSVYLLTIFGLCSQDRLSPSISHLSIQGDSELPWMWLAIGIMCLCCSIFLSSPNHTDQQGEYTLVFWHRCNKLAWTWFKMVQTYSLTVLEGRDLTSVSLILEKSVKSWFLLEVPGRLFLASFSSGGCTPFGCIMPITTVVTLHSPYKDPRNYVNPPI